MKLRQQILRALEQDPTRQWKVKELSKSLGLSHDDRSTVRRLLWELVDAGDVISHPKRRFSFTAAEKGNVGVVQIDGSEGYFIPHQSSSHEERIPVLRGSMRMVMDGDEVEGHLVPTRKDTFFQVTAVCRRAHTLIQGTYQREGQAHFINPAGHVYQEALFLPDAPPSDLSLEPGTWVEARILAYPDLVSSGSVKIEKVIKEGDIVNQHVNALIEESHIPVAFSDEIEEYAVSLGTSVRDADRAGRVDLRGLPLCTIDGETAKDFDDAVCALKTDHGYTVLVAIADVAHYVTEGSDLDEEAFERGTSVYLPGRCIPMLPENLSNRLCSLEPNVDRLCMVVQFDLHEDGQIHAPRLYSAVMHSVARLTYDEVAKVIRHWDQEADTSRASIEMDPFLAESLYGLRQCARLLRKNRSERGALDFSPTETTVLVGKDGEPNQVEIFQRHEAHMVIEDLMIAANEIVAEFFENEGLPTIYRIHEEPDEEKLERFMNLVQYLNPERLPGGSIQSQHLASIMRRMRGHHLQETLDTLLLRSMQQARYDTENVGHFGLSSEAYLHFTSPIRRYPDLMVHRRLKKRIDDERKQDWGAHQLERVAASCSDKERRAVQLERRVTSFLSAWLMKKYVGEERRGKVSGVTEFGIFVRLDSPQVDGFCHISELTSDYLVFDEMRLCLVGQRSGFRLRIGDEVEVLVQNVQLDPPRIHLRRIDPQNDEENQPYKKRSPLGRAEERHQPWPKAKRERRDDTSERRRSPSKGKRKHSKKKSSRRNKTFRR